MWCQQCLMKSDAWHSRCQRSSVLISPPICWPVWSRSRRGSVSRAVALGSGDRKASSAGVDEAVTELDDAVLWHEDRREGLGLAFLTSLDRAVESVRRWPRAAALVEGESMELEIRRISITQFPFFLASSSPTRWSSSSQLGTNAAVSGSGVAEAVCDPPMRWSALGRAAMIKGVEG